MSPHFPWRPPPVQPCARPASERAAEYAPRQYCRLPTPCSCSQSGACGGSARNDAYLQVGPSADWLIAWARAEGRPLRVLHREG
eukprot:scaffold946_cov415-Prasinococcus_capsulatus_cf.AAC.14